MGFPEGSDGKESACNAGDQVQSLDWEDLLEKGMATHFSILAWNNSIARGSWRVDYNLWGHKVLDTTE